MGQGFPGPSDASAVSWRRVALLWLVAGGLFIVVGAPLVWLLTKPADVAGDAKAVEQVLRAATTSTSAISAGDAADTPVATTSTTTTVPPSLRFTVTDSTPPPPGPAPIGLTIGDIEVAAPIEPYGVDRATGEMDVPENVRDVAWYKFGPRPGDAGSAVLAAHVDLASQGPGVFFRLDELNPGDVVAVAYEDGSSQTFRVEAKVRYDKTQIPLDVIFATDGPPVLTLITCGGGFNPSIRSYDSNIVVYAYPIEADIG